MLTSDRGFLGLGQAVITAIALVGLAACGSTYGTGTGDGGGTPPPPTAVAVAYCSGLEPAWVAFQDGDGAWTRVLPSSAAGRVTFDAPFSSTRGAVATLNRSDNLTFVSVLYGTPAELETVGDTNPRDCGPFAAKTLLGTVAGLGTDDVAFVSGPFFSRVRARVDNTFEVKALPSGPRDLLGMLTNGAGAVTGFILRRDIDLPDSTTMPVLDYAAPEAFAPAVANVSLLGLGGESATTGTQVLTSNAEIAVTLQTNPTTDVTRPYVALPETQLLPGDLQTLSASVSAINGSARSATLYFRAPTDRTLTLGAPLNPPTFTTVATAPLLQLRAHFVPQNDYDRSAVITYQQGTTTIVVVSMTAAYAALTGAGYDLVVPDLSSAAGFDPAWTLHPGEAVLWNAVRIGGTLGMGRDAAPSDGTNRRSVSGIGTIAAQ